jgi:hypothetical protein
MRKLIGAAAFAAVVLAAFPASAHDPYDYPWCLQGRVWGYPGLCNFTSYPQCQDTASGTDAYCGPNPRFYFESQQRAAPRPYRARRSNRRAHTHEG